MSITMSMVTSPEVKPGTTRMPNSKSLPPYHVVLLNDDDHSVPYMVKMLGDLFGHPPAKGVEIAREVHFRGRAVVATTNLEQARVSGRGGYARHPRIHGGPGVG